MSYYLDAKRYSVERGRNGRLRYEDGYKRRESNELISELSSSTASSNDYPTASPRYNHHTFYDDKPPKSTDKLRQQRRNVRSAGWDYYNRFMLPLWGHGRKASKPEHLDEKRSKHYKDETTSECGGFNVKICMSLVILLLVLLTAAGLGVGLGLSFAGDDGRFITHVAQECRLGVFHGARTTRSLLVLQARAWGRELNLEFCSLQWSKGKKKCRRLEAMALSCQWLSTPMA